MKKRKRQLEWKRSSSLQKGARGFRLDQLENGLGLIGPAEYEEMERLLKLYSQIVMPIDCR